MAHKSIAAPAQQVLPLGGESLKAAAGESRKIAVGQPKMLRTLAAQIWLSALWPDQAGPKGPELNNP